MGKKSSSEKLVIAAASAGAAVGAAYLAVGNAIFNKTMSKKSIAKKMDEKKNEYDGITKEGMEWFNSASPAKVKIVTPRGGYVHGEIILADEISPDTCRFWDSTTHEKLDKDRFRRDMGGVEEAYQEIMKRLMGSEK